MVRITFPNSQSLIVPLGRGFTPKYNATTNQLTLTTNVQVTSVKNVIPYWDEYYKTYFYLQIRLIIKQIVMQLILKYHSL